MKNDDYGFYGSGLDGYVHYRQGMAEAARSAPSSHSYDSYDSSDSDYDSDADDSFSTAPVYSHPVSKAKPSAQPEKAEGSELPRPVTPAPQPAAQKKEESSLAAAGKWLRNKWNAAWVVSLLVMCILGELMEHTVSMGVLYATQAAAVAVIVTSVIELVRAISFLSRL